MKKFKTSILSTLYFLLSVSLVFAQTQNRVIIDAPIELGVGSEFDTSFSLDTGEEINALELVVSYNPQEIALLSLDDSVSEVDIRAEKTLNSPGLIILKGGFLSPKN